MPSGDKQIQDVYHRPNLERARKGRLPLVFIMNCDIVSIILKFNSHDLKLKVI